MLTPFRRAVVPRLIFGVCIAAVTLGCPSTFRYRAVQGDFIEVVRIDNESAVDPMAEPLVRATARSSYTSIAKELTEEEIEKLDTKLRGNAWMIRAYSQWRAGLYQEAMKSARNGSKASDVQPRDKLLLKLIDALAQDSEARDLWVQEGKRLPSFKAYEEFNARFVQTNTALNEARAQIDPGTPPGTKYYVAYQRWRILRNWDQVISSVDQEEAESSERDAARALAEKTFTDGPKAAADRARDEIPTGHPLRQLIKKQGGET